MQIRVSTGNCRLAVGAALVALEGKIKEFGDKHREGAYEALKAGAIHNGLDVNEAREKEMREMVDRDLEHMMEKHPAHETVSVLKNFVDMLAYHHGDTIVIDDQDFHLLKEHLPTASELVTPSHDKPVPLNELVGEF